MLRFFSCGVYKLLKSVLGLLLLAKLISPLRCCNALEFIKNNESTHKREIFGHMAIA
jgi:hypothetical protein